MTQLIALFYLLSSSYVKQCLSVLFVRRLLLFFLVLPTVHMWCLIMWGYLVPTSKQSRETRILRHSVPSFPSTFSLSTLLTLRDRRAHSHWDSPTHTASLQKTLHGCSRFPLTSLWSHFIDAVKMKNNFLYISARTLLLYQMWDKKMSICKY